MWQSASPSTNAPNNRARRQFILSVIFLLLMGLVACNTSDLFPMTFTMGESKIPPTPTQQYSYGEFVVADTASLTNAGGALVTPIPMPTTHPIPLPDTPPQIDGLYLVSLCMGNNIIIDSRRTDSEGRVILAAPHIYDGEVGTVKVEDNNGITLFTYHVVIGRDPMQFGVNPRTGQLVAPGQSSTNPSAAGSQAITAPPSPTPQTVRGLEENVSWPSAGNSTNMANNNSSHKRNLFTDDFSDNAHGWGVGEVSRPYSHSEYSLHNGRWWQTTTFLANGAVVMNKIPAPALQNFELAFDARLESKSAAEPVNLMLIMRRNQNGDYYAIVFSDTGELSVRLWQDQKWYWLYTPTAVASFNNPAEGNRFTVVALDNIITVKVNGREALQLNDNRLLSASEIQLALEGAEQQTVTISIDNLTILTAE